MPNTNHEFAALAVKKAFEIAYAAFRVAGNTKSHSFAAYIESYGLMLLDAAIKMDKPAIGTAIESIRQFAAFGSSAGLINHTDADILSVQSEEFYSAIAGYAQNELPDSGLQDIFTNEKNEEPIETVHEIPSNRSLAAISARRARLLDKIRQSGNCRLKELQDLLPDTSERTLRYDLQGLVNEGVIERFGSGPGVYYRVHEKVIPMPGATPLMLSEQ